MSPMKPPPRARLVGPLGWWELVRLARRGQGHRARLLVLYFLFVAFVITPILWFPHADPVALFTGGQAPLAPREMAAFGGRFATVLLEAVLLAVAAMMPGYAATAVAEEKERGTLELLLTTPMTDREIVLGKAVGRCGFVSRPCWPSAGWATRPSSWWSPRPSSPPPSETCGRSGPSAGFPGRPSGGRGPGPPSRSVTPR